MRFIVVLICFIGTVASAGQLKNLKENAGTFWTSFGWTSGVTFNRTLAFEKKTMRGNKFKHFTGANVFYENEKCIVTIVGSDEQQYEIDKNDQYAISGFEATSSGRLSIQLHDTYSWPTGIVINCIGDYTYETELSDIEHDLDGILTFDR